MRDDPVTVRTTLDLDEDILLAAKELAKAQGTTAGKIVSELVRRALASSPTSIRVRNGVPLLPRRPAAARPTMALVNRLRDET